MLYFYTSHEKSSLLLLLLINIVGYAQLQGNDTSYTVDDGLAQNTVLDAKGYIWFGTSMLYFGAAV